MIALFLRAWEWAKGHKGIAIPVLSAAVAAFATWHLKPDPPQPKMQLAEAGHAESTSAQAESSHTAEGPSRETTRKYAPVICPSGPGPETAFTRPTGVPLEERLVEETVVERGPVITDRQIANEAHAAQDRALTLSVTPQAPAAGWALSVGFEDVLREKHLRLAGRRRLFGPIWAEVGVVPATRAVGAAVAVEW